MAAMVGRYLLDARAFVRLLRARPPDSSPRPKASPTRRVRRPRRLHSGLTACEASVRGPSSGDPPVADLGRASEAGASAQPRRCPVVPVVPVVYSLAKVTAHAESIVRARTTSMTPNPNVSDADPPSALVSG